MGVRLAIEFRGGSRKAVRGQSDENTQVNATDRLKEMLVTGYDQAKAAYNALPTGEDKAKFISVFEDFTEADFFMGAWRTEMVLDLIDDEEEAHEKLATLE